MNFTGAFTRSKMDAGRSASPHFPNDVEMVDANVAEVDNCMAVGLLLNCAVATTSAPPCECSTMETLKSTIESVPRNLDISPPSQLPIEGEELVQPHSIPSASGDLQMKSAPLPPEGMSDDIRVDTLANLNPLSPDNVTRT